jgi:hypothetical protein
MLYPTADEFRKLLTSLSPRTIVEQYIFTGAPFKGIAYVFRDDPPADTQLKTQLATRLNVRPGNIVIVGSAKVGFSLSPDNFSAPFSNASDIDVIVIDDVSYDLLWNCLLQWHYPRRGLLQGAQWEWAKSRTKDFYWGWIYPNQLSFASFLSFPPALRPLRDFRTKWFNAFRTVGGHPLLSQLTISGRLYRTWGHAYFYHMDSLRKVIAAISA